MKNARLYLPLFALLLSAALPAKATVHVVLADNFFYAPDVITIDAGDTVRFQWVAGSHPTSSTTGDWTSFVAFPLNAAQPTFDLPFPDPGTYDYQCDFHVALGMIGTVIVNPSSTCNSANVPDNQSHTVLTNRVELNWDPQPGAVACQVRGQRLPTGPNPTVSIASGDISTTNVPFAVAGAGTTWTWQVRCACSISPLDASNFSGFGDTFSIPLAKTEADLAPALPESGILVWPTAASQTAFLRYRANTTGRHAIEWMDLSGRVIAASEAQLEAGQELWDQLDISEQASGQYLVAVYSAEGRQSARFSVVR
jgi:plastocyanin